MYLLSLGEFDFENFGSRDTLTNTLMWAIFVIGTFLLQITFMNMLIAIMSEVFAVVTEKKQQSSLTERIELLNDFRVFLDHYYLKIDAQFFFLITPSEKNTLEDSLEERIAHIKEAIEHQTKSTHDRQDAIREDTTSKFQDLKNEMHEMNGDIDNKINLMTERILRGVQQSVKQVKEDIQQAMQRTNTLGK